MPSLYSLRTVLLVVGFSCVAAARSGSSSPRSSSAGIASAFPRRLPSPTAWKTRGGSDLGHEPPGAEVEAQATVPPEVTPPEPHLEIQTTEKESVVSKKLANVRQRTVPTILMVAGLVAWIKLLGMNGMLALVVLIQVGLYKEATSVVGVDGASKWWWFATAFTGTSAKLLAPPTFKLDFVLVSYGMAVTGLVAFVFQLNRKGFGPEEFRKNLGSWAACHLTLLLLVGQSSFWISILKQFGMLWILYPAALVAFNDTMAYVFGMIFGKHALLPTISPKKTWEGFVGATVSTLLLSSPLLKRMCRSKENVSEFDAYTLGLFVSLISPFGGHIASVVKRAFDKKDYGTWIPGHGGFVDRLDGHIITAPFVYLYLQQARAG